MKKAIKILIKIVLSLVSAAVAFVILLFAFLTIREYRPDERETLVTAFEGQDMQKPKVGDELTVVTWNVGCGTLGDNADFFMDYGEMVYTADKDRVKRNLSGITETLTGLDPDIMLLRKRTSIAADPIIPTRPRSYRMHSPDSIIHLLTISMLI